MSGDHPRFKKLLEFLQRVPAVQTNTTPSRGFGSGSDDQHWWVKFSLDIEHPLAWSVVQELAYVLNALSVQERLPTTFKPVSHRLTSMAGHMIILDGSLNARPTI